MKIKDSYNINIDDLHCETIVGIYHFEKEKKQPIILDIELQFGDIKSSESDKIKDTLDYNSIAKKSVEYVESNKFNLIEKLGKDVLEICFAEDKNVEKVKVKVKKPEALNEFNAMASITLEASR